MKCLLLCIIVALANMGIDLEDFYPALVGHWQYLSESGRTAEIEFDAACRVSLEWRSV